MPARVSFNRHVPNYGKKFERQPKAAVELWWKRCLCCKA
jgi:hypothetical protein